MNSHTNTKPAKYVSRFIAFSKFILIVLYLLILAGAIVRATGSGMGCPDWPTCFGKIIPPTDESQLPANYKELYGTETIEVATFNVYRTWIEYINRLLGVLLGFLVFIAFIWSFFIVKFDRKVFILSLLQLLLMGFQGWLGAKVVSSNLAAAKITAHMVVALIILAVQLLIIYRAKNIVKREAPVSRSKKLKLVLIVSLILSLVQIIIGTEVREEIDAIAFNMSNQNREVWISLLSPVFGAHRWLALAVLIINTVLLIKVKNNSAPFSTSKMLSKWLIGVICLQIALGVYMGSFGIPAFSQPIHLLLATIMFGLQISLASIFFDRKNYIKE